MRYAIKDIILDYMVQDERIFVLTGDLGYGMFDKIKETYPERFYNVGSSEMALVGAGIGLALNGKIPICFSITPFLLWRAAELHRLYLNHEEIPVKLLSSGRDTDYKNQGFSHNAEDAKDFLNLLPNIVQFWPENKEEMFDIVDEFIYNRKPSYLNLKR
jgi:transketolase